jgi:hypothetical protein
VAPSRRQHPAVESPTWCPRFCKRRIGGRRLGLETWDHRALDASPPVVGIAHGQHDDRIGVGGGKLGKKSGSSPVDGRPMVSKERLPVNSLAVEGLLPYRNVVRVLEQL